MYWRDEAGLTLVEVLVTIMIIGILAGIVTLSLGSSQRASLQNACRTNYESLLLALSTYQSDNQGALPNNLDILSQITSRTVGPPPSKVIDTTKPFYISETTYRAGNFTLALVLDGSSKATVADGKPVISVTSKSGAALGNAPTACGSLK